MYRVTAGAIALALVNLINPVVSATGVPTCFGKRATIVGTNNDPARSVTVRGTRGDDVIVGLRGSDRIEARGGDDLICSGDGDDYVIAGDGDDKVKGQGHSDTLVGGAGRDRLWGGRGSADSLSGGRQNDRLFGGSGHQDSLIGGSGHDVLDGGPGYDLAEFWDSPAGVEVDLGAGEAVGRGVDRLVSIEGLVGSNHADLLIGDDRSNDIQAGGGDDIVRALGSDLDGYMDILRSAGGNNILDGGEGPDIVSYNLTPWGVNADLSAGTTTTDGFGSDTLIGIEHLTGSKDNDRLVGNDEGNVIIGNGGDDEMEGRGGVDEASFIESRMPVSASLSDGIASSDWWGSDTLINFENVAGSAWRDQLSGDGEPNVLWGGDRSDSLVGLGGEDVLVGANGIDRADGGADSDACDAEEEVDCEIDPAASFGAAGHDSLLASIDDRVGGPSVPESAAGCVPAKARVAFVRDLGGTSGNEIFTVRPDGGGLSRLTDNVVDEWGPDWSPDGTRIAFSSTRDGNSEIYVMNRTGEDVQRLTHDPASDGLPVWSPDGTKIAFSSSREDPKGLLNDIYVMDADGSGVTKLVGGAGSEHNIAWSPDGRYIAFDRDDSIYRVRSDGTVQKRLTSRRRMLASNPSWSHDGRRILFQAQRSEENGMDLLVMKRDGSDKKTVVTGSGEQQSPSWSPDDRRIAFTNRWRVAIARADGSRQRDLFAHDLADYAVAWGRAVHC